MAWVSWRKRGDERSTVVARSAGGKPRCLGCLTKTIHELPAILTGLCTKGVALP
jgi:hypothetical protein